MVNYYIVQPLPLHTQRTLDDLFMYSLVLKNSLLWLKVHLIFIIFILLKLSALPLSKTARRL